MTGVLGPSSWFLFVPGPPPAGCGKSRDRALEGGAVKWGEESRGCQTSVSLPAELEAAVCWVHGAGGHAVPTEGCGFNSPAYVGMQEMVECSEICWGRAPVVSRRNLAHALRGAGTYPVGDISVPLLLKPFHSSPPAFVGSFSLPFYTVWEISIQPRVGGFKEVLSSWLSASLIFQPLPSPGEHLGLASSSSRHPEGGCANVCSGPQEHRLPVSALPVAQLIGLCTSSFQRAGWSAPAAFGCSALVGGLLRV